MADPIGIVEKLRNRHAISRTDSYQLFSRLKQLSPAQQADVLAAFRAKKETAAEILGALDYFLAQSITATHYLSDIVDIVGTGGDNTGSFNISTAASLVIASCGVRVAKHGGRSASSKAGSMDTVEALGLITANTLAEALQSLETHHYAYLWAPVFNSTLKHYSELRRKLGVPTIFNVLGPLINPLRPKRLVVGVYRQDLVRTVAEILHAQQTQHALVVHSQDGLDELSISAPSHVAEVKDGAICEYTVSPSEMGVPLASIADVIGGTPMDNAAIIRALLTGTIQGPKLDIVALNSAAGLYVAGRVNHLREGVALAKSAISSGKTLALLNTLTPVLM